MSDLKSKGYKASIDYTHQDTKTIKADGHGFWVEDSRNKSADTDIIRRSDAIKAIVAYESEVAKQVPYAKETFEIMAKREHEILDAIEAIPTADRPHGEWIDTEEAIDDDTEVKCSLCGEVLYWEANYCPNCGARMEASHD